MKAVMLSLRPQLCADILNEYAKELVIKTMPKLERPFKTYICCTNSGRPLVFTDAVPTYTPEEYNVTWGYSRERAERIFGTFNGKVCGEITCDRIEEYKAKISEDKDKNISCTVYSAMYIIGEDGSKIKWIEEKDLFKDSEEIENLKAYLGLGEHEFYIWSFRDCNPYYDEGIELSKFHRPNCQKKCNCLCKYYRKDTHLSQTECLWKPCLTEVPKNWCYVEEEDV